VLLEVATWNGPNIHRTSWRLGVRSEASARFEKGLAQEQCAEAQALATRLLIECCKARVLPGTLDIGDDPPAPTRILLRAERVHRILGIEIEPARQAEILEALGFATEPAQAGLTVTVPPHRRNDVTREADLIEEVALIDGLEKLSATLPRRRPAGRLTREQRLTRSGLDALVGRGLHEVVGWTFTSREALARLRLGERDARIERAVALENPLSEEHALLRPTLLSSLLEIGASNAARDIGDLRIFEAGTVFARDEGLPTSVREHRALGVLLSGRLWKATWREGEPPMADFHAIKAIAEALEATLRISLDYRPTGERHPFLRPGACAAVHLDGTEVGWVGELHPLVAGWELEHTAVLEVDLDALVAAAPPLAGYRDLTSYPALRNDLAVTLPRDVSAAQALAAVREAAGALLEDVEVFDVYAGPQVGEGRRSLALALAFRADDRTLTEHDIAPVRARVVAALGALGGELRG
jgi:phenylalanyl-tRNA synthetase beta chain